MAETDEVLMSRFRQGSEEAFEQLVRRWEDRMLNFFHRATGDPDLARDLRQDLFLRLYTRGTTLRNDGKFASWLFSVAANLVRGHFRKAKWMRTSVSTDAADNPGPEPALAEPPRAPDVVHRNDRARIVRELLATLSPREREVIVLRFFGQLRFREVSLALGIRESTAKVRAMRALERLRHEACQRGLVAGELL